MPETRKFRQQLAKRARQRVLEHLFPKITTQVGGSHRIVDQPPILFHVADPGFAQRVQEGLADYRDSLSDDRRVLLDRYRLEDCALKVVGIGSVGTRCYIGLMFSEDGHPLILQFKEARPLRPRALCREERLREPGPACRRGAAPDAVVQRHLPGMGARTSRL